VSTQFFTPGIPEKSWKKGSGGSRGLSVICNCRLEVYRAWHERLCRRPGRAFERGFDMLDSAIKEMRRVAHNTMPEALIRLD